MERLAQAATANNFDPVNIYPRCQKYDIGDNFVTIILIFFHIESRKNVVGAPAAFLTLFSVTALKALVVTIHILVEFYISS